MRFEEALKLARETGCGFRYKGRDDYFHLDDTELSNISMRIIVEAEWEIKHVETFAWGVCWREKNPIWATNEDAQVGELSDGSELPTFPFKSKALADEFSATDKDYHTCKATIQRCPEND